MIPRRSTLSKRWQAPLAPFSFAFLGIQTRFTGDVLFSRLCRFHENVEISRHRYFRLLTTHTIINTTYSFSDLYAAFSHSSVRLIQWFDRNSLGLSCNFRYPLLLP